MTEDAITKGMAAAVEELRRQYEIDHDGPYTFLEVLLPERIGVDGFVTLRPLVEAILKAATPA